MDRNHRYHNNDRGWVDPATLAIVMNGQRDQQQISENVGAKVGKW